MRMWLGVNERECVLARNRPVRLRVEGTRRTIWCVPQTGTTIDPVGLRHICREMAAALLGRPVRTGELIEVDVVLEEMR